MAFGGIVWFDVSIYLFFVSFSSSFYWQILVPRNLRPVHREADCPTPLSDQAHYRQVVPCSENQKARVVFRTLP
jgi:hypothetical protein